MNEIKFTIYALSSSKNSQEIKYIGFTKRNPLTRLKEHIRESKSRNVKNKKTHKENWIQKCLNDKYELIITIIENNVDFNSIEQREIYYIDYYKNLGCNLVNATGGGDGQKLITEETRLKISNSHKGKKLSDSHKEKIRNTCKLRRHTEDEKIKMSRNISGKNAGKKFSEERIEKMSNSSKTKKSVIQFAKTGELIKEFNSIKAATRETGIHASSIKQCCMGDRYKSAGGFVWRFSNDTNNIKPYDKIRTTKIIEQFTMEGEFLSEFQSVSEAARKTNICGNSIGMCCKGGYKNAGGFVWKYKNIECEEKLKQPKILPQPVLQYDFDNNFLHEYASISDAVRATGAHRNHIASCCKNKVRSSGGYIWKFKS